MVRNLNRTTEGVEEKMAKTLNDLEKLIDSQADDEGLWFIATTASEAYLQEGLRQLHALCEEIIQQNYMNYPTLYMRVKNENAFRYIRPKALPTKGS